MVIQAVFLFLGQLTIRGDLRYILDAMKGAGPPLLALRLPPLPALC
jgi:hypothetical protein